MTWQEAQQAITQQNFSPVVHRLLSDNLAVMEKQSANQAYSLLMAGVQAGCYHEQDRKAVAK